MTVSDTALLQGDIGRVLAVDSFPRTAVFTCDIEPDFGGRTGTTSLLEDERPVHELLSFCVEQELPLSCFVVTSLLQEHVRSARTLQDANLDLHAHSHTHDTRSYKICSREEIQRAQEVFSEFFGRPSLGYRAPQGMLYPGDAQALAAAGYTFDSSIFPARRHGFFDFRAFPIGPWIWKGGVCELPFASLSRSRKRVTVSMLKLRGRHFWERQLQDPSLWPRIFIIDSHLHDFFTPRSFHRLSLPYRLAYGRNREEGFVMLSWLLNLLKEQGYRFTDMSSLCRELSAAKGL